MRVGIVSFFMANVPSLVVETQHAVVARALPAAPGRETRFYQVLTHTTHAKAIDQFVADTNFDVYVLLDIDAIPLVPEALDTVVDLAAAGTLCGIAQRANHLDNGRHVYAGPAVLGVARATLERLGRPSFLETPRGDVGEELTYQAEARGVPIRLFRPCQVLGPKMWALDGSDEPVFGPGTSYEHEGSPIFYHNFAIRKPDMSQLFLAVCKQVLLAGAQAGPGPSPAAP